MRKKTLALLLQLPMLLLVFGAFFASLYAAISKAMPLGRALAVAFTLLVILVLYFWGRMLGKKIDPLFD